jgi:hypothetical protein
MWCCCVGAKVGAVSLANLVQASDVRSRVVLSHECTAAKSGSALEMNPK